MELKPRITRIDTDQKTTGSALIGVHPCDPWLIPPELVRLSIRPPCAPAMKIRLSIVEDDEPTRQILSEIIRNAAGLELVSVCVDAESALEALPRDQPDVVLTDINLPKLSGVECVHRLRPLLPRTQFLMLTVYEDADHIFA